MAADSTSANAVQEGHENDAVMPWLSDPGKARLAAGPEESLSESSQVTMLLFYPTTSRASSRFQPSPGNEQLGGFSSSRIFRGSALKSVEKGRPLCLHPNTRPLVAAARSVSYCSTPNFVLWRQRQQQTHNRPSACLRLRTTGQSVLRVSVETKRSDSFSRFLPTSKKEQASQEPAATSSSALERIGPR